MTSNAKPLPSKAQAVVAHAKAKGLQVEVTFEADSSRYFPTDSWSVRITPTIADDEIGTALEFVKRSNVLRLGWLRRSDKAVASKLYFARWGGYTRDDDLLKEGNVYRHIHSVIETMAI